MMLSMLSSWIGFFNIFSFIGDILGAILKGLLFLPMILIFIGVMAVAYFAEVVFKKLAGIDPIYLDGRQLTGASGNGQDLVYGFITDTAVQNVFWSIVALSIVLLFICTIVALIKSEFTIDLKGSAKGPIIGRALKSLVNFITVPVVTIIAVLGTNFLTKSIYDMFGGEDNNIVTKCFYVGAYGANRARLNPNFATDLANNSWSAFDTNDPMFDGNNPFAGRSQAAVADLIDEYFMTGKEINLPYVETKILDRIFDGDLNDGVNEVINGGYVNWSLLFFGYPENDGVMKFTDFKEVNYYYDLAKFDYILSVGSGVVMIWLLLSVGVVLLKRVFELTILFLLAPAMTAIAPLDGGQSEKKWRGEFMKRLLAVIGPIFAYNMYFLLVPLFESISLFGLTNNGLNISALANNSSSMLGSVTLIFTAFFTVFNVFFQLVCIFVGLSIVKSASALLSSLLGIEDLVKSGAENTKKAIDLGKKAALGATAVTGVAIRGAAAGIKKVKAMHERRKDAKTEGGKSAKQAKDELKGEEDLLKDEQKNVDEKDKALEEATENLEKNADYKDAKETIEKLEKRKQEDGGYLSAEDDAKLKAAYDAKNAFLNDPTKSAESKAYLDAKAAQEAAEKSRQQQAERVELRKKGISSDLQKELYDTDAEGNLKEKKNLTDDQKKQKEIAAKGTLADYLKAASDEEYGTDAHTSSTFAKTMDKWNKKHKELSKENGFKGYLYRNTLGRANVLNESVNQWLNPEDNTAIKRRFNDALAGMFGEGGGGELWKIWFNKNARANLYEGVPESKKRSAGIEQSLSWGARDKWQKDEDAKNARKEQEKLIRRMLAAQKGGAFAEKYERLYDKMQNETNKAQIDKLDAEIKKMEVNSGIAQQARDFYEQATPGSAKAKQLSEFKEALNNKAAQDAAKSERATKEKAFKATVATADKPLDVKMSDAALNKLIAAMQKGNKGGNDALKEAIEGMKEMNGSNDMKAILEALNRLVESIEKKV